MKTCVGTSAIQARTKRRKMDRRGYNCQDERFDRPPKVGGIVRLLASILVHEYLREREEPCAARSTRDTAQTGNAKPA